MVPRKSRIGAIGYVHSICICYAYQIPFERYSFCFFCPLSSTPSLFSPSWDRNQPPPLLAGTDSTRLYSVSSCVCIYMHTYICGTYIPGRAYAACTCTYNILFIFFSKMHAVTQLLILPSVLLLCLPCDNTVPVHY